jgi:hypothetical protein
MLVVMCGVTFIFGIMLCDDIVNKGNILLSTQLILVGTLFICCTACFNPLKRLSSGVQNYEHYELTGITVIIYVCIWAGLSFL